MNYTTHCAGVSSYTNWTYYNTVSIWMTINTSSCHFNDTPLYFSSILATNLQMYLTSYNAIYGASKNAYTIYIRSSNGMSGLGMLSDSSIYQWNVSWVGVSY